MESRLKAALALVLLAACGGARADDRPLWYLQIDNDVIFQTDRWYTSGVRIARSFRPEPPSTPAGAWLRDFLRPGKTQGQRFEFGLLQEMYTNDPKLDSPALVDRPYAGRLLLTAARHDEAEAGLQTLELDAGVRGPSAYGRQSQRFLHHLVPGPRVDWSRQLPDRFDGALVGSRSWEFALRGPLEQRVVLHAGGVLGNIRTFGHAGVELRIGTGGATTIAQPALRFAATPPAERADAGWSAFVGASARYVMHDDLLSENDNPFGPPLVRNRGILRSAVGFAWKGRLATLTFAVVQDTREFEKQRRNDRFGTLGLAFELF